MADEEQLALLKQGIKGWNAWRHEKESISIDLRGALLRGADLNGALLRDADLSGANLNGANLRGANLSGADLVWALLRDADLHGADLRDADLSLADLNGALLRGADLRDADLVGADLVGADLNEAAFSGADLRDADLRGADLNGATFYGTTLGNTNLINVTGLDSCVYAGPNTIDHRTLMRSWPLPLAFLRGCGLPDTLIDYLPSLLLNAPIEFNSCFISYSNKDEAFARRLHADLQAKGVRCWFAPEDMKIGDEFRSRIDQSIHLYERLLLIFSEHSIKSRWVQKEVETAFEKEGKENRLVLFPIRVDEAVMDISVGWAADIRRSRHMGDFTQWKDHDAYQRAFARLIRDLKAEATEEQKKAPR